MSDIAGEIRRIHEELPAQVRLVAVSKFHPAQDVKEAYDAGQRIFGESRVQELLQKIPVLPGDIKWHFIGHLQTNKVRQIIGKTALIESVDSEKLLALINQESKRSEIITDVLLQIHVAKEETKFGFTPDEYLDFFNSGKYKEFDFVRLKGVMGMASNTDNMDRIRKDFAEIYSLFSRVASNPAILLPDFDTVSMGMSGDWHIAVEEGSNMIRIGSQIFGERI